jgi:phage-related protein
MHLLLSLKRIRNAFDRVSVAMEHNKDDIKAVTDLFRTMADFFVKYIVPIIKYQLVQAIEGIGIAFSVVLKIIGPVVSVISSAINGLLKLIDGAIQRINSLIQAYNRISFLPNLPTIKT